MDTFVKELSSMQEAAASVEQSLRSERNQTTKLQQQILHEEFKLRQVHLQIQQNEFHHLKNETEIYSLKTKLMQLAKQVDELVEYKKKLSYDKNQETQQHQENSNNNTNNKCCFLCVNLVSCWNFLQHPQQQKKSLKHASELTLEEFLSKNGSLIGMRLSED